MAPASLCPPCHPALLYTVIVVVVQDQKNLEAQLHGGRESDLGKRPSAGQESHIQGHAGSPGPLLGTRGPACPTALQRFYRGRKEKTHPCPCDASFHGLCCSCFGLRAGASVSRTPSGAARLGRVPSKTALT